MWTPTTRRQYSRTLTRYQTDLTDAEWRVIAPHLPNTLPECSRAAPEPSERITALTICRLRYYTKKSNTKLGSRNSLAKDQVAMRFGNRARILLMSENSSAPDKATKGRQQRFPGNTL